ncbi:MAG: succinylglutamate desuccinylase/aspartoacylase family protein [Pirellulales bacterium]|nr:succinylglutamate desuccinylase/aspartoacylase family protein [Pirellulales bacterium]
MRFFALCVMALAISSTVAHGVIVLDADFDSGSLDEAGSSVSGNLVTLAGRDNYNTGDWKWLYFSADGVAGQQVTFRIGDNFDTGGSSLVGHKMVYSYDQQNWFFFENNVRNAALDTFTFSKTGAFTEDRVFIAYGLPYPQSRAIAHTNSLISSPWVSPTLSGDPNLVIGQSPGGIDDLGRTIAPQDMYGYKITDPNGGAIAKKKVVLIGGVHANETLGNFTLEGLVDFLVSDEAEAAILRKYAEFYVYPMANPDGRLAGYNRSTVQRENLDPNRYWIPPNYNGLDDIEVVGDSVRIDTGLDIDYLLDFHSTVNGKTGHYGFILPEYQSDPLWQTILQFEPEIDTNNALLEDDTAAKFGRDHLNAEFSATFETQFLPDENSERFFSLGRNFGLAFQEVLYEFADLNFDGVLNSSDWQKFLANAEADLSQLAPIDAYEAGDLNGDGFNDISDFALFKDHYIAVNGIAAFESLFVTIPEPCSQTLSLLVAISFAARVRSRTF